MSKTIEMSQVIGYVEYVLPAMNEEDQVVSKSHFRSLNELMNLLNPGIIQALENQYNEQVEVGMIGFTMEDVQSQTKGEILCLPEGSVASYIA